MSRQVSGTPVKTKPHGDITVLFSACEGQETPSELLTLLLLMQKDNVSLCIPSGSAFHLGVL